MVSQYLFIYPEFIYSKSKHSQVIKTSVHELIEYGRGIKMECYETTSVCLQQTK